MNVADAESGFYLAPSNRLALKLLLVNLNSRITISPRQKEKDAEEVTVSER